MDLIIKFFNIVYLPATLILLCVILPPYLVFKFITIIKGYIFPENLAGKVAIITGASSGIGEYLAYEYARRGACLALVARREGKLKAIAEKARELGSPDVIVISSDVSKIEDCKRFIDETVNHFGRLDHLVNNAGVVNIKLFEDSTHLSDSDPVMSTNFWGPVYATKFAIPHLRKSKGKIVVNASIAAWLTIPRASIYNASKAAIINFFDTLRVEFGSDIGITIVTPGLIDSEITQDNCHSEMSMEYILAESSEVCAKSIVDGTCRGERYVTEPPCCGLVYAIKLLCPELQDWLCRVFYLYRLNDSGKVH